MSYIPSQKVLEKYADLMVNFALNGGKGLKKHEVVRLTACECAKPLFVELRRAVLKAGGHLITQYLPDNDPRYNLDKDFFVHAREHQLKFFPKKYMRGIIDEIDHSIAILSETDVQALKDIDPQKIMARGLAFKPYKEWVHEKETAGKFTWTAALYGTAALAKEAGLSEKEYWDQIIKACYLDKPNPIKEWKSVFIQIKKICAKLDSLPIEWLRVQGKDVDLKIKLGEKRRWAGGSGANIPSFEIFTSPDWRGTEGWVKFDQPRYKHGNIIEGVEMEFKKGIVVKSRATKNGKLLNQMLTVKGANKVGEFALTDKRFSRITKFMAEVLYDENVGGPNGSFHIAAGSSYHDAYAGDQKKLKKKDWEKLGFNDSSDHTDFVSTTPRTVTAILKNGTEKIIYKNGMFTV